MESPPLSWVWPLAGGAGGVSAQRVVAAEDERRVLCDFEVRGCGDQAVGNGQRAASVARLDRSRGQPILARASLRPRGVIANFALVLDLIRFLLFLIFFLGSSYVRMRAEGSDTAANGLAQGNL
jgi:hypothetical protein